MRLDHLLSKEDGVGIVLLFRGQCLLEQGSYAATKFERTSLSGQVTTFTLDSLALQAYQVFTVIWCRCVCGTHPFPFRTRWLRHRRPMVLCWRRHGRAGGCQIYGGIAQLGERLPCKQEVTSSNLVISTKAFLKAQTMDDTIHKLAWMYRGGTLAAFAKCP